MTPKEYLESRGLADLSLYWPTSKPIPQIDYKSEEAKPTLLDIMQEFAEAYANQHTAQMREALQEIWNLMPMWVRMVNYSAEKSDVKSVSVKVPIATLVKTRAALSGSGEHAQQRTLEVIARRIVSVKNLYCDHNPGDPCDICALESILNTAPTEHMQHDDGWVKCSAQLPEEGKKVLLGSAKFKSVTIGRRVNGSGYMEIDGMSLGENWASHWRDLPSAPRKEGQ